jgi:hypothetical protein
LIVNELDPLFVSVSHIFFDVPTATLPKLKLHGLHFSCWEVAV